MSAVNSPPQRLLAKRPHAHDRHSARDEQQSQRRPSKFPPQSTGDKPQREHRPPPPPPNPRRERKAPQPIAAQCQWRATATAAAHPTPAATPAAHSPSPAPAKDDHRPAQSQARHSRAPVYGRCSALRSRPCPVPPRCGNSDIGTSVANTSPNSVPGDRDLIRNDLFIDIDERRRQHPAQQQRMANELPVNRPNGGAITTPANCPWISPSRSTSHQYSAANATPNPSSSNIGRTQNRGP